ncbi:bacteriocin immunity protein [Pseudomonas syringae group genomosp. 3]|uniref:S-type pyocin domain-containing protein n=1 Tax=Pseudomonas syringae pv. persicae TaxID=237306 RepID=A0AB38E9Z4_9PSED|nr:bacteriocin immunity protein [Pseudomonas syringae group genomosp. 3]SOQ05519.1 S-type pyocin domain-containing protein [Pseudomonas syringae pv. persicae]SOQ05580.1 S-type pyocin domain-containing protein [Pseudomonas syringae pv. persicae]
MELKQALKDYTQQEFSTLLSQIWTVRTDKAQHDKMIRHFDEIVDLSEGADLLFYPKADDFGNTFYSGIDRVISHIRTAYYQQGKTAFKDDILPEALSRASRTTSFNAQDHAIKKALQAEVKSQKIISRVNETLILTQEALDHFERLLKTALQTF